ncbi:glycosyltransferase family 2 protein [Aeromonas enteropelogenes]|uniref:glycosyltransferase family 2 protein n=1 Tax=Aeromonas enteropelogenes TaxID=29489 RepID=UPI0039868980
MLSIVIPVYNSSKTIIQCLNSVVEQNDIALEKEIVIINDGSTDNSEALIKDFIENHPEVIIKYKYKENGGVSRARNLGIQLSAGTWIAFLDSDDIWLPNKLSVQLDIIHSSSFNIDFIGCARNNEVLSILGKKITSLHKATITELLIKMFPQTSTAIVKRELLIQVGCYDETMTHAEDGDLWLRLCQSGDFYYMPESLVITGDGKHNYGESGLSSNLLAMHKGTLRTIDKLITTKKISKSKAIFFKVFYFLKYIRRIVTVYVRAV